MDKKKEKERKLFELRNKRNQARKINKDEVLAETIGEKVSKIEGHDEYLMQRQERERQADDAVTPAVVKANKEKEKMMNTTGLDMDFERSKKAKTDKKTSFSWDIHNNDSKYKSYKKRLDRVEKMVDMKDEYRRKKQKGEEDALYRDVDDLNYGDVAAPSEERLNLLVGELKAKDRSNKEFSRRRADYDEKDVSYINSKNKKFVGRLDKAYGEYTEDIKANFERGTAL